MIGDIYFVKSSSTISFLIRLLTNSSYSHVAISVSEDNSFIVEADAFKKVKPKENKYKDSEVVSICLSELQKLKLLEYCVKQTDVKYDYVHILGIALGLLGFTKRKNLWNHLNRTICSELISEGYQHIGVDLLPNNKDDEYVTPSELANELLGKQVICKC